MECRDIFGNAWALTDGAVTLKAAGTDEVLAVDGPSSAPVSSLQPDFEGFIWALAGGSLFRLNPRGSGYTDNGCAKRATAGSQGVDCVGEWDGNKEAHKQWLPVSLPGSATALCRPTEGDHVVVIIKGVGAQAVTVDSAGAVQFSDPATSSSGWRTLRGLMPCGNHDIMATVADGLVYVAGGAVWWYGYPASEHMHDELWAFDPKEMATHNAWKMVCKLPAAIAFSGLAATADGKKLYLCGGCKNSDGIPNKRSDERQLWIYDIAAGVWDSGPDMLVARQEVVALELGGRIYAFGWDKSCESIAPGESAWRREEAQCPIILGGDPVGDGQQFAGAAIGTTAYFVGPFGLLAFDSQTGAWTEMPKPPQSGRSPLFTSHKGRLYMMSGFFYDPTPGQMCHLRTDTLIFDPANNTWEAGPELPSCEAWGAAFSVGDYLYTAGGAHWSRTARTFIFDNRCFALRS